MATPTQDEIEKKEADIAKLRDKLSDARDKEAEHLRAVEREIRMTALEAEEERLQKQLDVQKERSKKSAVRDGTERLTEQVSERESVATQTPADTTKKEG